MEGSQNAFFAGKVGIGTTNPIAKLDVAGSIRIPMANNVDNQSPGIVGVINDDFQYDGEYLNQYGLGFQNFSGGINAYLSSYYGIDFFTGGNNRLRINNNGNVGIGTISPETKMHLTDGGQSIKLLSGTNTSDYTLSIGINDDGVNFSNNSSNRGYNFKNISGNLMTIMPNGNVGIGTINPGNFKLAVEGKIGAREANRSQRHHRLDRPRFDRLDGQHPDRPLTLVSQTAENAVIFSDGIEADYIEFNSGTRATISIADKHGTLVV